MIYIVLLFVYSTPRRLEGARRACRRTTEWIAIVVRWRRPWFGYRNQAKNFILLVIIPDDEVFAVRAAHSNDRRVNRAV